MESINCHIFVCWKILETYYCKHEKQIFLAFCWYSLSDFKVHQLQGLTFTFSIILGCVHENVFAFCHGVRSGWLCRWRYLLGQVLVRILRELLNRLVSDFNLLCVVEEACPRLASCRFARSLLGKIVASRITPSRVVLWHQTLFLRKSIWILSNDYAFLEFLSHVIAKVNFGHPICIASVSYLCGWVPFVVPWCSITRWNSKLLNFSKNTSSGGQIFLRTLLCGKPLRTIQ